MGEGGKAIRKVRRRADLRIRARVGMVAACDAWAVNWTRPYPFRTETYPPRRQSAGSDSDPPIGIPWLSIRE